MHPRSIPLLTLVAALGVAALFALNVERWAFLGDDAYISFRYARHLAEGQGLVWNPGERVEGYTNFLWVLLLAAGLRLGVAPEGLSQLLGIASGVGVLALLVRFGWRRYGRDDPFLWLAPAWLAASRTFSGWSTGGLETQLFTLAALAGCLALLDERTEGATRPWRSSTFLALATLTRPEGALFATIAGACFLGDVARGRRRLGALVFWAMPLVVIVGAHVLWRWSYYGALLPNTFHAKVNGVWWEQGLRYLGLFASDYKIGFFLPVLVLPILMRRGFEDVLFTAIVVGHLGYVTAVGGDRFEFRFWVFVLPFLGLLLAQGLRLLAGFRSAHSAARAGAAAVAVAALAATHLGSIRPEARELRSGVNSLERIAAYAARRAEEGQALRALVERGVLPEDLRISVGGAGALPYYTRWYTIDYFGLNDAQIARGRLETRGPVGHEHRASVAYLSAKGVVVFDILNRMLYRLTPRHLIDVEARLDALIGRLRTDRPADLELFPVCRHVEGDQYLLFATPLPAAGLPSWLGTLEPCGGQRPR